MVWNELRACQLTIKAFLFEKDKYVKAIISLIHNKADDDYILRV